MTPAATEPTTGGKPVTTPKDPSPAPVAIVEPAPAARRAIPAKPEQASVRKTMKEVYAEQLVDRSAPARRKLTLALLEQADKSSRTPTDEFVLLAAAVDAAVDAGDLSLAFQAADRMAGGYEVDALSLKAETAARLNPLAGPAGSAAVNVAVGLELVGQLIADDDYGAATRVCSALQPLAAPAPDLRAQLQARMRDLGAARAAHERVARDAEKLLNSPDDPAANLVVGRYTAFVKGDWRRGLHMMSRGSDETLKTLAAQELAGVSEGDAHLALADGWWDVAVKQPDAPSRAGAMGHAAALYKKTVERTDGLRRAQIEKRIAEAAVATRAGPGGKRVIDLLKMIDPKRDAVHAKWQMSAKGLTCDNQGEARLAVPYDPPDEYDYHVVFSRNEGSGCVHAMFGRNGNVVSLAFWGDRFTWGLNCVDGKWRGGNVTTGGRDIPFKNGQRHDTVVKVRKDSVTALLDGKEMFTLKSDFSNLKEFPTWELRGAMLGVAAHQNSATFHVIEILELTGTGKPALHP